VKTFIGAAFIVVDVIVVKALMIASHAPHAGNKVAEGAIILFVANVVAFWLLGKLKKSATPFGGSR
jgi:hypothetical protein